MNEQSPLFDQEVGERFRAGYYDQIRGHVRQEITRRNLMTACPEVLSPGLRVLDIGGGEGSDSFWLASLGHDVVLLDESARMLNRASETQSRLDSSIAERVTIVQGTPDILDPAPAQKFDLVLSHGVLMYLADPTAHVHEMIRLSKPEAKFSVLTRSHEATRSRLLARADMLGLERLERDGTYINNLGAITRPYTPDQLAILFRRSGLHVEAWFGVRVHTDLDRRLWRDLQSSELEKLLEIEEAAGRANSTRGMGQMLHMVVAKTPPNLRY